MPSIKHGPNQQTLPSLPGLHRNYLFLNLGGGRWRTAVVLTALQHDTYGVRVQGMPGRLIFHEGGK